MKRFFLKAGIAYAALACALFALQAVRPHGFPFDAAPARTWDLVGFVGMLAPLVYGGVQALGVVRDLERKNRARPAWALLATWLLCFAGGEAVLGLYRCVASRQPPTPSAGDVLFLLGYGALLAAGAWFVRVYATSGFPLGTAREGWTVAGVTALSLTAVAVLTLGPMVRSGLRTTGDVVALAYPVLDFLVLVPTALLLAMTRRFRGGRVWIVWAYILSGFVVLSAADLLFAYQFLGKGDWADPLQSLTFIAGYTLTAVGVAEQRRLVKA